MTIPTPEAPLEPPVPTQVKQPTRTTVRSVFQGFIAFAVIAPLIVETTGFQVEDIPWLAGALAVLAAIVRVMALPQVEEFLRNHLPFLAAQPTVKVADGRRVVERGAVSTRTIAIAALVIAVVIFLVIFVLPELSVRG